MTSETAHKLAQLTEDFYARAASSFSATRSAPWQGWERVIDCANARLEACPDSVHVCDLACGNLRFERFAAERFLSGRRIVAEAYDSCDSLVVPAKSDRLQVNYHHLNVAEALFRGQDLGALLGPKSAQLVVCFGFMHHLALPEHRLAVLKALYDACAPGGLAAISFWQLSCSPRLLKKAQRVTAVHAPRLGLSDLGIHDYLLGWQDRSDVLRYCHDFSDDEIDELLERADLRGAVLSRYAADGATENLNRYVLLGKERF